MDARQLIYLIMERAVEREARLLATLMLMDDAVRGFPSAGRRLRFRRLWMKTGLELI